MAQQQAAEEEKAAAEERKAEPEPELIATLLHEVRLLRAEVASIKAMMMHHAEWITWHLYYKREQDEADALMADLASCIRQSGLHERLRHCFVTVGVVHWNDQEWRALRISLQVDTKYRMPLFSLWKKRIIQLKALNVTTVYDETGMPANLIPIVVHRAEGTIEELPRLMQPTLQPQDSCFLAE